MGFHTSIFVQQPVDQHFLCLICHEVQEDPTLACGNCHTFCSDCLTTWQDHGDSCPKCRAPLTMENKIISRKLQTSILALQVQCPKKEQDGENRPPPKIKTVATPGRKLRNGKQTRLQQVIVRPTSCPWTGPLADLQKHQTTECDYNILPCPQCNELVRASEISRHRVDVCTHRAVPCSLCHHDIKACMLETHESVCPFRRVSCQHCGVAVRMRELPDHFHNICPKISVPCTFVHLGCSAKVPREELEMHCCDGAHVNLLSKALQDAEQWHKIGLVWEIPSSKIAVLKQKQAVQSTTVQTSDLEFFLEAYVDQENTINIALCITATSQLFLGAKIDPVSIEWKGAQSYQFVRRNTRLPTVGPGYAVKIISFPLGCASDWVSFKLPSLEASFGGQDSVAVSASFKLRKPDAFRVRCAI